MKVIIGKEGLENSWQEKFPEETGCCRCGGMARIGFVAIEGKPQTEPHIYELHQNGGRGDYWPHDYCAVAVYFCRDCLESTALYNQA